MRHFNRSRLLTLAWLWLTALGAQVGAQESYFDVALADLEIESGELPARLRTYDDMRWRRDVRALWPRIVLPSGAEGFFASQVDGREWIGADGGSARLVVRADGPGEVRGELFLPNADWTQLERVVFVLPADAADPEAKPAFLRGRHAYYQRLSDESLPGAAWFRHRERQSRVEGIVAQPNWWRARSVDSGLDDSYTLFTGGRALAENLQLDRALPESAPGEALVPLDSVRGVTVREWEPNLEGEDAPHDPLAEVIPADQHALFMGSFEDLVTLVDETERFGAPVLGAMETRSQSAQTISRYEVQLGLSLDSVVRLLGPLAIASVAVTGSDPYLRTGSDVAVLLEAKEMTALRGFLATRHGLLATEEGADAVSGEAGTLSYTGVVTPDRRICSYVAETGGHVVVSNSLAQLERISAAVASGDTLHASPEYRFFRRRYALDDARETALAIVPDAAIRRWCGPRWRIATGRRTLALAAMAELQASRLDAEPGGALVVPESLAPFGPFSTATGGVSSGTYGSLQFLTPIAELQFDKVTEDEERLYGLWRAGYERNWSNFFDPIAARFAVSAERVEVDLSVIPLILGSDYRDFSELVGTSVLAKGEADPHPEALVQYSMAIDPDSKPMREIKDSMGGLLSTLGATPLAWFRGDLALYADESPFWSELASMDSLEDVEEALEVDLNELPVMLHFGVKSPLKLATFLTAVRAISDTTVPGLVAWTTKESPEGHPYVKIGAEHIFGEDYALYYAATPRAFLMGLNEKTLHRAVARAFARLDEEPEAAGSVPTDVDFPAGAGLAFEIRKEALLFLQAIGDESTLEWMQARAWSNLPILGEWKKLYPDRDAVAVHTELWGEELRCPGGGEYIWNEEWHTFESTVYGHPGEPREGPALPASLATVERLRAQLTFEEDGLRARAELLRK